MIAAGPDFGAGPEKSGDAGVARHRVGTRQRNDVGLGEVATTAWVISRSAQEERRAAL